MSLEIKKQVYIQAKPEVIFPYLTQTEKAKLWFGVIVEMDSQPGGIFKVGAHDQMMATGEFIEIIQNKKVVFSWGNVLGLEHGESTVEIELEEQNEGTLVTLRHFNIVKDEAAQSFGDGWESHAFPLLKLVAEGGQTEERCFRAGSDCDQG